MSTKNWFKPRRSAMDFGRPANWKGWITLIAFVFLFACLAQMLGMWALGGFAPLVSGIWLFAGMFLLVGLFVRVCNAFTPTSNDIAE